MAKYEIYEFLKMTLYSSGLKKGIDYIITSSHVYFKIDMDSIKKRKITATLENMFPQCFFFWEGKSLIWE